MLMSTEALASGLRIRCVGLLSIELLKTVNLRSYLNGNKAFYIHVRISKPVRRIGNSILEKCWMGLILQTYRFSLDTQYRIHLSCIH